MKKSLILPIVILISFAFILEGCGDVKESNDNTSTVITSSSSNLAIVCYSENNSGEPAFLMDTKSIKKQDINKTDVKYFFIAYFFNKNEVNISKPVLFELWAQKHAAYYKTTDDINSTSSLAVPQDAKPLPLSSPATHNLMKIIFEYLPKTEKN